MFSTLMPFSGALMPVFWLSLKCLRKASPGSTQQCASAILTPRCGIHGTVYKSIIFFGWKLMALTAYYQYFAQILCLPGIKGAVHKLWEFVSFYFNCDDTMIQIQFTWLYTFRKHQLKCWTKKSTLILPARSLGGAGNCRKVVFATWSPLDLTRIPRLLLQTPAWARQLWSPYKRDGYLG